MSKVKLTLSYDGTDFGGWQKQKVGKPTIQGELESCLTRIFAQPVSVVGSGRTDAGVHARGQVAHFTAPKPLENYNLLHALNSMTCDAIAVLSIERVADDFHAIASCKKKTYKYYLQNSLWCDPFRARFSCHFKGEVSVDVLNALSRPLIGVHDFKSFQSAGTEIENTVREIFAAHWIKLEPNFLEFTVSGNGFLKQMVRNIVGLQLDLMRSGTTSPGRVQEIMAAKDRTRSLGTAPANGLILHSVEY